MTRHAKQGAAGQPHGAPQGHVDYNTGGTASGKRSPGNNSQSPLKPAPTINKMHSLFCGVGVLDRTDRNEDVQERQCVCGSVCLPSMYETLSPIPNTSTGDMTHQEKSVTEWRLGGRQENHLFRRTSMPQMHQASLPLPPCCQSVSHSPLSWFHEPHQTQSPWGRFNAESR